MKLHEIQLGFAPIESSTAFPLYPKAHPHAVGSYLKC